MAIVALHSAATGLSALSTEIDVVSNNLANVNTTGFKRSRVNFEDLVYQQKEQPGVENADGSRNSASLQVGLGTKVSNTQYDFSVGNPVRSELPFDVFIDGPGFFKLDIAEDRGGGFGYSRSGNFFRNNEGDLVLGNSDGPRLEPPVNVPEGVDTRTISISADGRVSGVIAGDNTATEFGQVLLSNFVNPNGLQSIGGNIFIETDVSGPPIEGVPGEGTAGTLLHKFLEGSNVDPVQELITLIKTQRAFELNSQTIQAADQVLQVVGNLRRF
ncbi:MAG: flagellar basal-body rod protein FlgG [Planctomycetes bacterium]|jgi:flagellar basal-body rod protein FlgG|nr:flagellar basal-body rod protein FlgG [Planctomycetota bacterium]